MDLEEVNGDLLLDHNTRTSSPQHGTPQNEERFESILYIYQSGGRVKRPESVPIDVFLREMRFFQMGEDLIEEFWISEGYEKPKETILPTNTSQRRLWELMEYPDSSLAARIIAFVSVAVITISIVSFCWETVPSDGTPNVDAISSAVNATYEKEEGRNLNNPFFWVELLCIVWFTIELTLRFISCPSKVTFLTSFLNIIDFVAIAPFFVNLIWADASKSNSSMSFTVLRVLRLVRVFRIFKLSRHSAGLQILGKTFRASVQEFCLLVFFMAIALVLFSAGMYFAEQGEQNSKFSSIPASFWFVLVSGSRTALEVRPRCLVYIDMYHVYYYALRNICCQLILTGDDDNSWYIFRYGDLVPLSTQGKIVGSMCALIGVLTLALPVPIIVANFKHFYRQENRLATMCTVGKDLENGEESGEEDS
ncbi:unnamed protein product [Angiostrongylus costaricensis]|uniref:Ion_trans domain-containing protein n=1 Tax=Angiostrongylus costaricensis TaxID=334426 RepID=A0A158PDH5_ANGCS|nr:unnamed protein product [Angiostrongylus costaricensis]